MTTDNPAEATPRPTDWMEEAARLLRVEAAARELCKALDEEEWPCPGRLSESKQILLEAALDPTAAGEGR